MYNKHNLQEYEKAMHLRKEYGWGATKISSFLFKKGIFVSKSVVSRWIYRNGKPFDEILINKIPKSSNLLTDDKAYILGVLCGDGYIRISKNSYLVGLDVCDEDFADEFRRCLNSVYELLPSKSNCYSRITNFTNNAKPRYRINLTSKLVVQDLLRYSSSFKTKEWQIPEEILMSDLKIKSAFLRGLFDSEGTIRLKKKGSAYLQLCSGHGTSLTDVKNILEKDFQIFMKVKYNQNFVTILYTERYLHIKNFFDRIDFTIKRKKYALNFCLSSYKRKGLRSYDQDFKFQALKLLDKGYSPYKVGKMLNFPYTNIYDWKNGKYMHK